MAAPAAITDEEATWRDCWSASGFDGSDGNLALSEDRLTFATTKAGVVLNVDLDGFDSAQIIGECAGRFLRSLKYFDDTHASFWVNATVAQDVVDAIHARRG